ncbi:hypothetical protein INS49_014876 [Diaporthe citri]|uniref:uncharacterized protein n=1 Tax=Diaporthe citri TaxID=83186 RepID=UPI001C7E75AD|nr:uncharacterized protein INS49_014876 [Diaporthe citri]KAG6357000.1 hypothetical protein INS49_014876 [Diaporthe citri]
MPINATLSHGLDAGATRFPSVIACWENLGDLPADVTFSADGRVPTLRSVIFDAINSVSGEIPAKKFRKANLAAEGGRQRHAAKARLLFQP